jgi:hypothetical protein
LILRQSDLRGIAVGEITLAFRKWRSPTVKTGGRLRTSIGELAIDEVRRVDDLEISEADAHAAGCASRAALLRELARRDEGSIYRIRLHLAGADPRLALREDDTVSEAQLVDLRRKIAGFDARSAHGPWVRATLELIADRPACRAADLAKTLGCDKDWLKTNVRKLKELGLTESLEVGYRISPRGAVVLRELRRD